MHSPLPNANQPLASLRGYFFGGAITSFAAFATRNFTTVLALILIDSPVCGFRPRRALRSAFTKRPMPGITNTPFFFVSLTAVSASRSKNAVECLLVNSSFSANCFTSAVFVKAFAAVKAFAIVCLFSRYVLGTTRSRQKTICRRTLLKLRYSLSLLANRSASYPL
jgi:hypothetical protein